MTSVRKIVGASRFATTAVVFIALASGIVVLALFGMRADAIDIATVHIDDMATILAEDVANMAAAYDVALRDASAIVNGVVGDGTISPEDTVTVRRALAARRAAGMRTEMIGITDAAGDIVVSARNNGHAVINVADREYFRALRDDRKAGLYVSRPLQNKLNGAWTIFLARRIETPSGRFLGVAFAGVEPAELFQLHADLSNHGSTSFSLFYDDGTVAMRRPDEGGWVGKSIPSPEWRRIAAQGGGLYHSPGVLDADPKYVAVRPVAGYPFFVNVTITDQAALAAWRGRATAILVGVALGVALVVALLYSQMRLVDRLSRSRIRSWMRGKRLAANASELSSTRKRLGLTLDYISQGLALYDADENLVFANRCYAELYGLREDQLRPGMNVRDVFALRIAAGAYGRTTPQEYMRLIDEPCYETRLDHLQNGRIILVRDKEMEEGGWVTVQEDATERTRAARELAHTALHDSLTQLPNRQAFKTHLSQCLARRSIERTAVLLVDIDGFKEVNDTYGHEIGDNVLVEVSRRLLAEVTEGFVARLGGDEFAVVISGAALDAETAMARAERLIAAVGRPFDVGSRLIAFGLCVGVNFVSDEACDLSDVMRRADLALYAAKNGGRNCARRFDEEMERRHSERVQLAQDLREALGRNELSLHYQPIVNACDRSVVCLEALARWSHPTRGPISPAVFVPIAEENGLIVALGNAVLRRACADAAAWRPDVVVAVNVSALQIERCDFVETVMAAVEDARLAPQRLQLEITESILLRNSEATGRALSRLRAKGVTFALDDFGTGFASLSYLKAFPLDKVKIDKSFVDDICLNQQSIAIVAAIVALARGLGVQATAEGVETQDQYDILRAIGVPTMQGYFFGRPKAIEDCELGQASALADAGPRAA